MSQHTPLRHPLQVALLSWLTVLPRSLALRSKLLQRLAGPWKQRVLLDQSVERAHVEYSCKQFQLKQFLVLCSKRVTASDMAITNGIDIYEGSSGRPAQLAHWLPITPYFFSAPAHLEYFWETAGALSLLLVAQPPTALPLPAPELDGAELRP